MLANPEIIGYYGSVTEAAVVEFQKANDIDPIGIVGPRTRAALNGD
jgi:peptidoglycan hydrolase-like protein with peptidoglycan-binding domain